VQHATCGKRYGLRRATCTARRAVTARAFVPRLHSRLGPDRSAHLTVRVPHGPHPGGTQRTRRYSVWRAGGWAEAHCASRSGRAESRLRSASVCGDACALWPWLCVSFKLSRMCDSGTCASARSGHDAKPPRA
jgi:hypothetical protein